MAAKPLHPAFVHFPIAFFSLGFGMDILYQLSPQLPGQITSQLPASNELTRTSYNLISLGLVTAVPAVASGVREAVVSIGKQGLYETDGKTIKQKFKAMIAHAVANDLMLAATAYIWYSRRAAAASSLAGKLGVAAVTDAYAPAFWMVLLEGALFGFLMLAASIGGTLTYNFGMGFSAMSSGKKTQ